MYVCLWVLDGALRALLPERVDVVGSYETAGHVARVTLKPEQLPWKMFIGQVLIDKVSHIKTVVNKVRTMCVCVCVCVCARCILRLSPSHLHTLVAIV